MSVISEQFSKFTLSKFQFKLGELMAEEIYPYLMIAHAWALARAHVRDAKVKICLLA